MSNQCRPGHETSLPRGSGYPRCPQEPWEYGEDGFPLNHNVPRTTWGCSICKLYLCKKCFRMEDEDGKPHPDAWDHRAPTRGLMSQGVVCE